MKKSILALLTMSLIIDGLHAQTCSFYYPTKEGAVLEYSHYDKKGKLTGTSEQKITTIKKIPGGMEAVIAVKTKDAKGQDVFNQDMNVKCENGIFYFSMDNYIDQSSMSAYKDMNIEVKGDDLQIPTNLKAGDILNGGSVTMTVENGGMKLMNMTVTISDRKADGIEKVTTPAGTFDCYKISYDATTKMMITIHTKGVEWYAKDVGLVKSESYMSNGKLAGSTVLTSLK